MAFRTPWYLALAIAAAAVSGACGSAPHDAVSRVPLGSRLSELESYYPRGAGSSGEVVEFISVAPDTRKPNLVSNEFGVFERRQLGSYDEWEATPTERDNFTGEILFYHHAFTRSDVNRLFYFRGMLRLKDWGFLPG